MAEFWKGVFLSVLTEKCYDEYFVKYNFQDGPCFKSTLSKGLGIGIIAGSILVKVPQILKILSNKSVKGINFYSICLELFAITTNFAYSYIMSFPFSSWGEGIFLAIQTAILASLVLHYGGSTGKGAAFLAVYMAIVAALISGKTPVDVLWNLQAVNVPIICIAKTVQIITNFKNSSTGQLSAITLFLIFGGSVARIFTSIQETGDVIIILTYCVSALTNWTLVLQMIVYWNNDETSKNKKKKRA